MMNRHEAATAYNANTAAVGYILGAVIDGIVYRAFLRGHLPESWTRLTRESSNRGGAHKLALQADKVIEYVREHGTPYCKAEAVKPRDKRNAGEWFEFFQLEEFEGATSWRKDSTPFWVAGDVTIGGEQWQVKFQGASLARLDVLERLA
jgi:hypothetical protein